MRRRSSGRAKGFGIQDVASVACCASERGGARGPGRAATRAGARPRGRGGLPVASVPCGFDARGLPVGMQVIGRPFAEATVLRAADAFQRETDWHMQAPPAF